MYLGDFQRAGRVAKDLLKLVLGAGLLGGCIVGGLLLGPCGCAAAPQVTAEQIKRLEQVAGHIATKMDRLEAQVNAQVGAGNTAVGGDQTTTNQIWPWAIITVVLMGAGAWRTWVWRRKRRCDAK